MSSYIGRHAALYDLFYSEKNYTAEADFVDDCLKKYSQRPIKRLLEIACGTGNHAFLLEKKGYQITAIDYSESMIQIAQSKAAKSNSRIEFKLGDMTRLPILSDLPFDAAICLFDSIGYSATNENILAAFKNISNNLRDNGILVFEFWHGSAMLKSYDPLRVKYFTSGNNKIQRVSETTINHSKQTCTVKYTITEMQENSSFHQLVEEQTNRFFLFQEMNLFVTQSGFEMVKSFDGYSQNETIGPETWHVVMVVRKTK